MKRGLGILILAFLVLALTMPAIARGGEDKPDKPGKPDKDKDKDGRKGKLNKRVPDYFGFPRLYRKAIQKGMIEPPLPRPLRLVRPELSEEQWAEVHELEKALNENREEGFYSILNKKQLEFRTELIKKIREAKKAIHDEVAKKLARFKSEERQVKAYAKMLLKEKKLHIKIETAFHVAMIKLREECKKRAAGLEEGSEEFRKVLAWLSAAQDALRRKFFPIRVIAKFCHEQHYLYPHYFHENIILAYLRLSLEQKMQLKQLRQQWDEEWNQALQQILSEEQWESLLRIRRYYHLLRNKRHEFCKKIADRIARGKDKPGDWPKDDDKDGDKGDKDKPDRPQKPNRPGGPKPGRGGNKP
ncbi:MAG: hypothetical protein E3J72_15795 [Planctomycetota bacterium]|nr:MAG: hypothetical protein E3J72_15795 [Planctomycetota bacterium]